MENYRNGEFRKIYARIPASLYFKLREQGLLNFQFDAIISDLLAQFVGEMEKDGKKIRGRY